MKTRFSGQDTWFAKHGISLWDDICHRFTSFNPAQHGEWFNAQACVDLIRTNKDDGYKRQRVSFVLNKMLEEQSPDNPMLERIGNSYRLLR